MTIDDDELASRRAAAAAEVDRWERQLEDAITNLLDRQRGVVLARLSGVKARKNTRHWMPPGEQKIDPRYVLDAARWAHETAAAMRTIFGRLAESAVKITKEKLSVDEDELPAAVEAMIQRRIDYVANKVQDFGAKVQALIEKMEDEGAPLGDIEAAVKAYYDRYSPAMAKRIAATQAASAHNEVSYAQALLSGAEVKQWLSSRDERVRATHDHADGQRRRMVMPFRLGGIPEQPLISLMQFPGDPTGPLHEVMNCRCTMLFSLELEDAELAPFFSNIDLSPLDVLGKAYDIDPLELEALDVAQLDLMVKALPKTQVCKYCDAQATKRLLWAEGMAYIPVCDEHEAKGRHRIEVTNHDEVLKVMTISDEEKGLGFDPLQRRDNHGRWSRTGFGGFGSFGEQMAEKVTETIEEQADRIAGQLVAKAEKSEPHITPVIEGAVDAHGGWMEGLEHRLKTHESTKRKLIEKAKRKRTDARGAAAGLSDIVRYTAVIPTDDYSPGVRATLDALAKQGFRPTMTNNYWPQGDAYSGLNILLAGKGQDFEVQFHTPESFAAKDANHLDYEVSRDTTRPLEERQLAWARMVEAWDKVLMPDGALDFRGLFLYDAPGEGTGRGRYISKWRAEGMHGPEEPPPPPPPKPKAADVESSREESGAGGPTRGAGGRGGAHRFSGVHKMASDGRLFPWSKEGRR